MAESLAGYETSRRGKEVQDMILAFLRSKSIHIFIFIVVNAVVGSIGIWMPILAAVGRPDVIAMVELQKQLAASGPYIFAVAYLAGSTSFVAYEYLDTEQTDRRKTKTALAVCAFVLIIVCTLLSALQAAPIATPGDLVGAHPVASAVQTVPRQPVRELNVAEWAQLVIVALASFVGLLLYVISRLDDPDIKATMAAISAGTEEESKRLSSSASRVADPALTL